MGPDQGCRRIFTGPILLGYERFNVYRGDLSALVDGDGDGVPDGGFFYLMSRVRDGAETDLGSTSAGLPRVPTTACPP